MTRTKEPNPLRHATLNSFRDAYVAWATADLPRATHYDDFATAEAKRRALTEASISAIEVAWDIYDDAMEMAAEAYERGVGPAWAD